MREVDRAMVEDYGIELVQMMENAGASLARLARTRTSVRATATLTLALPKTGLLRRGAGPYVGELYLADIGMPPRLYGPALGITIGPIFAESDILRLR